MTSWQGVALENIASELKNIREILEKQYRAEGEWENYKDEHRCTKCGEVVIGDWYGGEWYDYCPNCGAKMEG